MSRAIVGQYDGPSADHAFESLVAPYRPEVLAYCYRMIGSIHEAEDLTQETMLRAWRAHDRFEGRSSLRTWLYRIATRVCLTALEARGRRPLPSGLGAPTDDPDAPLRRSSELVWLEPAPDHIFGSAAVDPARVVSERADIRLAFVAALQGLSARQRAVLLLRDVLGLGAAESSEVLGTTTTAVNSALLRARRQIRDLALVADAISDPPAADLREMLDAYVAAFETGNEQELVQLLRSDVELEMPPNATWFTGRDAVVGFLSRHVLGSVGAFRMNPVHANAQPAVAAYIRRSDDTYEFHALHVLSVLGRHVSKIHVFLDEALYQPFVLPQHLDAAHGTQP